MHNRVACQLLSRKFTVLAAWNVPAESDLSSETPGAGVTACTAISHVALRHAVGSNKPRATTPHIPQEIGVFVELTRSIVDHLLSILRGRVPICMSPYSRPRRVTHLIQCTFMTQGRGWAIRSHALTDARSDCTKRYRTNGAGLRGI